MSIAAIIILFFSKWVYFDGKIGRDREERNQQKYTLVTSTMVLIHLMVLSHIRAWGVFYTLPIPVLPLQDQIQRQYQMSFDTKWSTEISCVEINFNSKCPCTMLIYSWNTMELISLGCYMNQGSHPI